MLPVACLTSVLLLCPLQDAGPAEGTARLVSPAGEVLGEGPAVDGRRHGRWRHRYPGGELAAVGPYKDGRRAGTWTFHRSDGSKLAVGKFNDGVPQGRWQVFQLDGKLDAERTGEVEAFDVTVAGSALRALGRRLDGELDGPVCVVWPNGVVFLDLTYERGVLVGAPRVQPPAGPGWTMRGVRPTLAEHDAALHFGFGEDGLPRSTFEVLAAAPAGAQGWTGSARVADPSSAPVAVGLLEQALAAHPAFEPPALVERLGASAPNVLALALEELVALGPAAPWTPRARALVARIVEPLTPGFRFGFDSKAEALGAEPLGGALTVLALCGHRPGYFTLDVPLAPVRRPLAARLEGRLLELPIADWCRGVAPRGKRGAGGGSGPPKAASTGPFDLAFPAPKSRNLLRERWRVCHTWLARAQRPDGLWPAAPPNAPFDTLGHELGVSSLALLALLQGDGSDPAVERAIVAATRALLASQDPETGRFARTFEHAKGRFLPFAAMYEHMLVTEALATVAQRRGSLAVLEPVLRAADMLAKSQNPYGAFGYAPVPDGTQDTSITYWGVRALLAAESIGWRNKRGDWRTFIVNWVEEVTDPATCRVGYDSIGSISARAAVNEHFPRDGEPMTAAGIWLMHSCAPAARAAAFAARSEGLLRAKPPAFAVNAMTHDMYYWLLGTSAYRAAGGPSAALWAKALIAAFDAALAASAEPGSIDPSGPWGMFGGRAYSTAALALAIGELLADGP